MTGGAWRFGRYQKRTLSDWVKALERVRFVGRVPSGHVEDYDAFEAALRFDGRQEIARYLYDLEAEPGWATVAGGRLYVSVEDAEDGGAVLHLSIGRRATRLTRDQFEHARRLDALLEAETHRVLDPPVDSPHCITPERFPELWEM